MFFKPLDSFLSLIHFKTGNEQMHFDEYAWIESTAEMHINRYSKSIQ